MLPTADAGYLSQFYSRSRLHHLSTWASELRDLVRSLRSAAVGGEEGLPGPVLLSEEIAASSDPDSTRIRLRTTSLGGKVTAAAPSPRILMHIDLDCFFVSVCLRDRPELVGKLPF